jgi:hypothetical protein
MSTIVDPLQCVYSGVFSTVGMTPVMSTLIVILSLSICVSHVPWLVVSIGVYPVERHTFGTFPKVFKKVLKAVVPSVTDFDTSAAVVGVRLM